MPDTVAPRSLSPAIRDRGLLSSMGRVPRNLPCALMRFAILLAFPIVCMVCIAVPRDAFAETPAQVCERLAGDAVQLDAIDGASAVAACSSAVAAAPQDKHLQYEYARALERTTKTDEAKQIYQWIGADGYAPANAALARLAGPLTGEAADREKFAQKLDAIATIAARVAKSTPRDHDDPDTVLAQTGKDPAKILAWVKANTRIVPYAGMLRGASGVLMDRAGNSLDRALFLADLLHRAGSNARIARAQISPQAAEALRARFAASAPKPAPPAVPDKAAMLKQIGNDPRLDQTLIEQAVDKTIAGSQQFDAEVKDLYGKVLPAVLQAVGTDPARDVKLAADADAVLRDHFWVQRQNGGAWDDLDPDADLVGKPVAAATFLPSETPAELKQRVSVKLSIETLSSGKLSETPILEQSWLPSQVAGQAISIVHSLYPAVSPDMKLSGAALQKAFLGGITDTAVSLPAIIVRNSSATGRLYSFDGKVEDPTPINLASMGGTAIVNGNKLASGIASAFGDAAPAPAPAAGQGIVVAEWLEIDIDVPGKATEKHRRAIFDLIGGNTRARDGTAAARFVMTDTARANRALALSGTIDLYILSSTPTALSLRARAARQLGILAASTAKSLRTQQSLTDTLPENPVEPLFWKWLSFRQMATSFGAYDSPNIALLWRKIALAKDGSLVPNAAFDIVSNSVVDDSRFDHRVAQGVADTVAEHVMLGGIGAGENTAVNHASDLASGKSWTVLRLGSDASKVSMTPAATVRIASVLANGGTVIAPALDNAGTNWWRIDAVHGTTLGIGPAGMGTAALEESKTLQITITGARAFKLLGCAVLGVFSYVVEGGKITVRTAAEGAVCLGASLAKGVPVPGYGAVLGEFVYDALFTAFTTPPEGPEGKGEPSDSGSAPSELPGSPLLAPVCSSPDQGC